MKWNTGNDARFIFVSVRWINGAQNSILLDAQSEGIAVWDRDVDRYLHSNRVSVYNPLEEFIFHLPNWDKKDRITELADRVPCANPHWTMLFHRWFLNMVAHWRGYDRQHANSTSPLLVGAQGTRKSTFCRDLIPPGLRGYYTDSIDFSRKRDAEMYLNRFALININEFDQITLTQQGFLKHILQKPVVNLRKSYSNSVQELRRYASFIATSNQKDLLTDPSGSRRFMCVEVTVRLIRHARLTMSSCMHRLCTRFVMASGIGLTIRMRLSWHRGIGSLNRLRRLFSYSIVISRLQGMIRKENTYLR